MRQWIRLPRIEGRSSRQAHCDLPEGTYERELGREGFFGPSAERYHRHPPHCMERVGGSAAAASF
jgi:homogentisate 1,2-dioxygenase